MGARHNGVFFWAGRRLEMSTNGKAQILFLWPEGEGEENAVIDELTKGLPKSVEVTIDYSISVDVEKAAKYDLVVAHYPGRWPKDPMPKKVFDYARALDELIARGVPVGILWINLTRFPFPWPAGKPKFRLNMAKRRWNRGFRRRIFKEFREYCTCNETSS
jgi:hypothetical protein